MLLKYVINGKDNSPQVGSKKIDKYCNKIIDILNKPRDEHLVYFEECKDIIEQGGWASKDRLKRSLHTSELKEILKKK